MIISRFFLQEYSGVGVEGSVPLLGFDIYVYDFVYTANLIIIIKENTWMSKKVVNISKNHSFDS